MEGQNPPAFAQAPRSGEQQQQYPPQQSPVVTPPSSGGLSSSNNARKTHSENRMLITKTADIETEDGRISNREAAEKIKDAWMYKQIRARQDEFTQYKQVCVC